MATRLHSSRALRLDARSYWSPPLRVRGGTQRVLPSACYAQALGTFGLALFVVCAQLDPEEILRLGQKGDNMWVKILGLVCVGVFVGAALIEAKQLRKRKKDATDGSSSEDEQREEDEVASEDR